MTMVCRLAAKRQSRACPELSLAVRDRYAHQAHAITPDDRSQLDHYLLALLAPTGTYWHLLAPMAIRCVSRWRASRCRSFA